MEERQKEEMKLGIKAELFLESDNRKRIQNPQVVRDLNHLVRS